MNIAQKQYALAWYELLADKRDAREINKKMLKHLYKTGRLSWISEILRHLEEIDYKERSIDRTHITTAHEIPDKEAKELAEKILKTNLIISKETNPDLIAGVQIETRNKRWDLSLKNQLLSLSKQLT